MDEKKKFSIYIPDYALAVMEALWDAGEEVYIVGGCVRDCVLGSTPHDYDMAVSCPPERTLEILSHFRTVPTGLSHGTVTAISDGRPIELTTFRVDGSYTDMRRPDSVSFTRSIDEDLARRDFTVNAMAYSPKSDIIDLFGGIEDARKGIIRAVGEPERRFGEDALRIMRAFRFSAQLGFSIDSATAEAAAKCRDGLSRIASERICAEFIKLICSSYPEKPLLQMKELGILPYVTAGYIPSDRIISLVARMPDSDTDRLGMFLAAADRQETAAMLSHLKCSNRQKNGATAISQNSRVKIACPKDATLLRARIGEYALSAIKASVLLGENGSDALDIALDDSSPCKIADLAVDGGDMIKMGIGGRDIGKILEYLLSRVIDEPLLNQRDTLMDIAKVYIKENK